MATSTTRLGLRKPTYTDLIDEELDLATPFNRLDYAQDAFVGASLPVAPDAFSGQIANQNGVGQLVRQSTTWRNVSAPAMDGDVDSKIVPSTNLIVLDKTNGLIKRRVGSSWNGIVPVGIVSNEARYYKTNSQSVDAGTIGTIAFNAAHYTSPDITPSSGNSLFTLNRGGLWRFSAGFRVEGEADGQFRYIRIAIPSIPSYFCSQFHDSEARDTFNVKATARVDAGTTISLQFGNNAATARSNDTTFPTYTFLSMTWLRP